MKKDTILKHRQQIHYIQSKSSCRISLFTSPSDCSFCSQLNVYTYHHHHNVHILQTRSTDYCSPIGHICMTYQVKLEVFRSKPLTTITSTTTTTILVFLTITPPGTPAHHMIVRKLIRKITGCTTRHGRR